MATSSDIHDKEIGTTFYEYLEPAENRSAECAFSMATGIDLLGKGSGILCLYPVFLFTPVEGVKPLLSRIATRTSRSSASQPSLSFDAGYVTVSSQGFVQK